MKTSWKRALLFVSMMALSLLLVACGNSNSTSSSNSNSGDESANLTVWADTELIPTIKGQVEKFEKENPEIKVTVKEGNSADAKKDVSKDPSKAADVFMLPHDQVGQLVEAGLLYPVATKNAEEIKKENTEPAVEAATYKDKLYGFPYGVETQVLYYNKAKLNEDQIKTWKDLTTNGVLGSNLGDAGANYIFTPLFVSNGDVIYGENGEDPKGTNFNNEAGVEVLKWIASQRSNKGFLQTSEAALADLQSGKSSAFLSGPWSKNDVKKALGDNMGAAAYPTVDLGHGEVPMKAFLGVKLFGVNQQTKSPVAAMKLAAYLTNEDSQKALFTNNGTIPSNKALQSDKAVTSDDVARAVIAMSDEEHSIVMPKIPEMVSFWPPMDALINDTYKGKIAEKDYKAKLDQIMEQIQSAD